VENQDHPHVPPTQIFKLFRLISAGTLTASCILFCIYFSLKPVLIWHDVQDVMLVDWQSIIEDCRWSCNELGWPMVSAYDHKFAMKGELGWIPICFFRLLRTILNVVFVVYVAFRSCRFVASSFDFLKSSQIFASLIVITLMLPLGWATRHLEMGQNRDFLIGETLERTGFYIICLLLLVDSFGELQGKPANNAMQRLILFGFSSLICISAFMMNCCGNFFLDNATFPEDLYVWPDLVEGQTFAPVVSAVSVSVLGIVIWSNTLSFVRVSTSHFLRLVVVAFCFLSDIFPLTIDLGRPSFERKAFPFFGVLEFGYFVLFLAYLRAAIILAGYVRTAFSSSQIEISEFTD
jgi:hypothetical protein